MPQWVKVLAGCLALIIGGSATPLIICSLNPPSPSSGERQQQHHNTAPQKHTDGDDTKSNSDNAPIGIEHVYTKNNDQVATKREPEGDWYANPDWWVATFTGLLFGATAGLWAATWSLYRTTRKAVIEGQQ